jgi:hypothetical protein
MDETRATSQSAPSSTKTVLKQTKPKVIKQPEQDEAAEEPKPWSAGKRISYLIFGCLGTILGIGFFLGSVGFLIGSRYMQGIINEIGSTSFTKQMERLDHYGSFFDALSAGGSKVQREDSEVGQGEIYYLWQVTAPGSDEARVFRWRHDLAANTVVPLNNPALLLDLKLGYIKEQEAQSWQFDDPGQKYDPADMLTQAMVKNDFSLINPADLADPDGVVVPPPDGPVGAPLISPEEASHRGAGSKASEEEGSAEGGEGQPADPGETQPVEPGTPSEPGPGTGGDQGGGEPADPGTGGGGGGATDPGAGNGGGGSDPGAGDATDVH